MSELGNEDAESNFNVVKWVIIMLFVTMPDVRWRRMGSLVLLVLNVVIVDAAIVDQSSCGSNNFESLTRCRGRLCWVERFREQDCKRHLAVRTGIRLYFEETYSKKR